MDTHTAGPWRMQDYRIVHGYRPNRDDICDIEASNDRWEANAQLIAAAPDLLAALQALIYWHEHDDASDDVWSRARAAINKAEGKE